MLLAALVLRLAIAPFGQYEGDITLYRGWGDSLADDGPGNFYATSRADHLPGDLWVIWGLGEVVALDSREQALGTEAPVLVVKLVPILADLAIVALLFAIGRRLAGPRAGLVAAGLYAFNPAPIFLASVWGQWDSLSAAFALLAVLLFLRGQVVGALPALTYAALVKPQLALIGVVFVAAAVLGPRKLRASPRQFALGGAVSLAVLLALTLPFDVPPWPGDSSLFEQASTAFDRYQAPSVSAFNFWALWSDVLTSGDAYDSATFALGISYRTWGAVLLLAALAVAVVRYAGDPGPSRLLWACLLVTTALFALPTRVHERYFLPAIVFAAAVAACDRRYRAVAVLLSVSCFANLYWIYNLSYEAPYIPQLSDGGDAMTTTFALLNLGLLAFMLLRPPRSSEDSSRSV
ncbi:MAG: hypothetical protein AABM29_07340 [Actinomycetota bacterium]